MILIYDKSKVYVNERKFTKDTTSLKCDYPFDIIASIKDNI